MAQYIGILLSFFRCSLAIRNVWPGRMSLKAFLALYVLLLLAGMPVTLLSCIPYGLFGILVAACIYGLVTCRETASRNVCMSMIGLVLAVVTENFLSIFLDTLFPPALLDRQYFFFAAGLVFILLFYFITLLCGRLLRKLLLPGRGILRLPQTWYLIDAALLLLITIYLFDNLIPGQNGSVGRMIYNNALHISGYLLVMLFCFWRCAVLIWNRYRQRQSRKPCRIYRTTRAIWKSCITVCAPLSMITSTFCYLCPVILKAAIWKR